MGLRERFAGLRAHATKCTRAVPCDQYRLSRILGGLSGSGTCRPRASCPRWSEFHTGLLRTGSDLSLPGTDSFVTSCLKHPVARSLKPPLAWLPLQLVGPVWIQGRSVAFKEPGQRSYRSGYDSKDQCEEREAEHKLPWPTKEEPFKE
jgi:hypothetical protein